MSRLVVVTGGGGGIGRATAARFAALGDEVLAPGRAECDVTDEASVAAFFERAGAVDVLVNNAGMAESAPLARTTLESWRAHLDVNATGAFLCTRAVVRRDARARARARSSPSPRPPAAPARRTPPPTPRRSTPPSA